MLNLISAFCKYGGGSLQSRNYCCCVCDLFALCLYLSMSISVAWAETGDILLVSYDEVMGLGLMLKQLELLSQMVSVWE
jgi:hypothetical protein